MSTTRKVPDDTRQAQQLIDTDQTAWLDDAYNDDEAEWGADPMTIAERRELRDGVNAFGEIIQ